MRSSPPLLGIKGIFPIIKRHAPRAISYPARFSGIANSRIAIDATLLLQRLHFAPDPHPARHILGLVRLMRVLRSHSIRPIMVFDNPDPAARLPQKERERERRSRARQLVRYRSQAETRRGRRLLHLEKLVAELSDCSQAERREVARLLAVLKENQEDASRDSWTSAEVDEWIDRALDVEEELDEVDAFGDGLLELGGDLFVEVGPLEGATSNPSPPAPDSSMDETWASILEAQSGRAFSLALRLHQLRASFERSTTPQALDDLLGPESAAQLSGGGEVPNVAQLGETAQQAQLTAMEAEAYAALASADEDPIQALEELERKQEERAQPSLDDAVPPATTVTLEQPVGPPTPVLPLSQIASRYATLSQSYARRVSPIPASLLAQSAELCSILGVPVLFTGGGGMEGGRPHEAEALCASLVRDGWADMVASEDSDVLLYGARLLRNLIGTRKELELVDPDEVRRALFGRQAVEASPQESAGEQVVEGIPGAAEAPSDVEAEDQKTQRMLLDFALLCGTDFNRTIPGIASNRALDLIRRHGDISTILSVHSKRLQPPSGLSWREFQRELQSARDVFAKPPSLRWHTPELRRHGLEGEERRERRIEDLVRRREREKFSRQRARVNSSLAVEQSGEESGTTSGSAQDSHLETEEERQAWVDAYSARLRRRFDVEARGAPGGGEEEFRQAREQAKRLREFLDRYAGDWDEEMIGGGGGGGGGVDGRMGSSEEWDREGEVRWEDVWEDERGMKRTGELAASGDRAEESAFGQAPFGDSEGGAGERRESAVWTP